MVLSWLWAWILVGVQPPSPVTISADQLQAVVERVLSARGVPALGVAVVMREQVVVAVSGVRKRGEQAPVTPADRWHLGSDTKAMTALLIARLVQRGQLRHETTLAEWLPDWPAEFPADWRDVSVSQLLRHRAGLPANLPGPGGWNRIPQDVPVRQQRLLAMKQLLMETPAKQIGSFEYSNAGYVILGHMAERVAAADWETLMQRELFAPLGMTSAGHGPPGSAETLDQPWPHDSKGKPLPPTPTADNPPVLGPAGRVHASLGDWAKFIQDTLRGAAGHDGLLPAAAYRPLLEPLPGEQYTLGGWIRVKTARGPALTHDGSNTLNYCSALLLPESGCGVLVVCNQGGRQATLAVRGVQSEVMRLLVPLPPTPANPGK